MDAMARALSVIRTKAKEQRDLFGQDALARGLEWAARCVEGALLEANDREVDLREAASISGYSPDHLGRMVRDGKLPDRRPGVRGRLRFRVGDLPRKPGFPDNPDTDVQDLASRLNRGKERHYGP